MAANKTVTSLNGLQIVSSDESYRFKTVKEEQMVRLITDALLAMDVTGVESALTCISRIPSYNVASIYTEAGLADISNQVFMHNGSTVEPSTLSMLNYIAGRFLCEPITETEKSCDDAWLLAYAFSPISEVVKGTPALISDSLMPSEYKQRFISTEVFADILRANKFMLGIMLILAHVSPENMAILVSKFNKALNS